MFKRGEMAKLTAVITLVIVAAFLFLGIKPFESGPTGLSFYTAVTVNGCAVINESTDLASDVQSNGTCITINASNIFLNCTGFSILYNEDGSNTEFGISVTNKSNITIQDCTIIDISSNGTDGYNIQFVNTNDSLIVNNTIVPNSTGNGRGVFLNSISLRNIIDNNTFITFGQNGTGNAVFAFSSSTDNNITRNNMTGNGTPIRLLSNSNNYLIKDNIINMFPRLSGSMNGVESQDSDRFTIVNNTITLNSTTGVFGISFTTGDNSLIENNTIVVDGSGGSTMIGITVTGGSFSNVTSNIVTVVGSATTISNNGLRDSTGNNRFLSNHVHGPFFADSFAFYTESSSNTVLENNIFNGSSGWIFQAGSNFNFTNTTFVGTDGIIRYPGLFQPNGTMRFNQSHLNITSNNAFANSSTFGFLNTSAQITLFGITATDPRPIVDFDDGGTFEICNSPQCVEESFSGGIFVFNVSSFTTYSSEEAPGLNFSNITITKTDAPDPVENGTQLNYSIFVNVTGNATSNNITVNETYPAEVIFDSASPSPLTGTNTTFILGNLTPGTNFTINITVNVSSTVTNMTVLNNTVNVTFQNESGFTTRVDVVENTTVENVTITPAPATIDGGGGGGNSGGGGGGVRRPEKEPVVEQPLPLPEVIPRKEIQPEVDIQEETVEKVVEAVPTDYEQQLAAGRAEREQRVLAKQRVSRVFRSLFYGLAAVALIGLTVYWYVLHHKKRKH